MQNLARVSFKGQSRRRTDVYDLKVTPLAVIPPGPRLRITPEALLLVAMLVDAIELIDGWRRAFQDHDLEVERAQRWIECGDCGAISFRDACMWLGLDGDAVRRAILSRRRRAA
jgi:hypothetical protein